MSKFIGTFLLIAVCMSVLAPVVHADAVTPVPVDAAEDQALQQLETETGTEVEDTTAGLSQMWAIVGIVLVSLIVIGAVA